MVSLTAAPLRHAGLVDRMSALLGHRGPDSEGRLAGPHAVVGAHRLRIVDRSAGGDQPFVDQRSGRWLAANGEIYNSGELRQRYPCYPFASRTDVEPIIPLFADRGVHGIADLDGMFALAVWDGAARTLVLARDRSGEKPLFYLVRDAEVWFASEAQALLLHPAYRPRVDHVALSDYLTLGSVREPRTMFDGIARVPSGAVITFTEQGKRIERYWDPGAIAIQPRDEREAAEELGLLLRDAVRRQLVSDRPLGILASGGLDSTLIAALAREVAPEPIPLFSAGFEAASYDESAGARRVAARLGCPWVGIRIGEPDLHHALEMVSQHVAEPVGDPAVLPTYLIAREAGGSVSVLLGGEGADELFGGYPTYLGHRLAPAWRRLPPGVRRVARSLVEAIPASGRRVTTEYLLKRFVAGAELPAPERHLFWFGPGLGGALRCSEEPRGPTWPAREDELREAMLWDLATYLRDNLLVKLDRAAMLSSVECRAPYLDRRVMEFALSLDTDLRVRGLRTKYLLRRFARTVLPGPVVRRVKRGLSVPVADWINGGLSAEVDRLLQPERIDAQGVLRPGVVLQLLREHRSGVRNRARSLWPLITFQLWMERWIPGATDEP